MGNICSNSGREEKKNPMIEPSNDTEDESPSPDSAPFVAAVLNDRTVTGLIQEIDVLQCRENKRLSVQITGKNGSPIYYEDSLKNAKQFSDDEIYLDFDNLDTSDGFPLRSLDKIEIRLGGVVVQRFKIDDLIFHFVDEYYDEENQMETIWLNINRRHLYGPITCVEAYIGPLPLGWRQGHAGNEMLLTDLFERVADENNDLTPQILIIKALSFCEKDIIGMMT